MKMGDLIVLAVLVLVVGLIIRGMIRDKKSGGCGGCGGCSGCPHAAQCGGSCSGHGK